MPDLDLRTLASQIQRSSSTPKGAHGMRSLALGHEMMHLLEHLTNPSAPLKAVFEALPDEPLEPIEHPTPAPETGRLGNGVVQRAVVKVLAAAGGPMRGADIHLAVECLLGHPVSKHSVSWCLGAGARAKEPRFERVAYGSYRLVP